MKISFRKITTWSLAILLFAVALSEPRGACSATASAQTSVKSGSFPQEGKDIRPLEPDEPVEREIAGGQAHYYQLLITTEPYICLEVEQRGIDTVMTLFDSSGKVGPMSESVSNLYSAQRFYTSMSSGTYLLEVRASEKDASAGRYKIEFSYPRPLELGKPVVRKIAGGQTHEYHFRIDTNQYISLEAEQQGIDIVMFLSGPSSNTIYVNRLNSNHGTERLSTVINPGRYELEVRSPEKDVPTGRYEIKIKELRAATPQDETQIAVKKASADWESYRQASMQRDLKKYEEHLLISRAAGDRKHEVTALRRLGETYDRMGERQKSLDFLNQALLIWKGSGNHAGEANILCRLGEVSLKSGEDKKASDYFRQATSAVKMEGDPKEEVDLLFIIGGIYRADKQYEMAIDYYQQSRELSKALGDRSTRIEMLWELEGSYASLGDYQSAANYKRQAREAIHQNDKGLIDHYLNAAEEACDQAMILQYEQSRESDAQAIEKLKEALNLYEEAGKRPDISDIDRRMSPYFLQRGRVLMDIGYAYGRLGEHKKEIEYLEQFLVALQASNQSSHKFDSFTEPEALRRIGEAYLELGDKQKALDYVNRSLKIFPAIGGFLYQNSYALNSMAKIWFAMGDKRKAHEYWDQAISLYKTIADTPEHNWEWETLLDIGRAYLSVKEFEEALKYFNQCLQLGTGAKDREITVRSSIARLELERGNPIGARSQIETVLAIVESFRNKLVSDNLRVSYFSSVQSYYELYIDILMRLSKEQTNEGHDAAALQASERARARSLIELLIEAHADIQQGADAALVHRERSLRDRINSIDKDLFMSDEKLTKLQAAEKAEELQLLVNQLQQVRALIKAKNPRYAALTQPQALSLKEIQQSVLDPDTSLLEYSLGDERSYLWLVTQSSIQSYELPKRSDVEAAARRVYELLTARQQVAGRTDAERLMRIAKADAEFQMASMELSKMVLGPVSPQLRTKRLLIVADGALQFVPFAALPVRASAKNAPPQIQNGTQTRGNNTAPLMFEHEIVNLPSASALAVLRSETTSRRHADKAIAVLADPVFGREDYRVRLREEAKQSALKRSFNLETAMRDVALLDNRGNLSRLPFSREEAEAILAVAPKGQAFKAIDFKASKAMVESPEMSRYGIVHFATHGLLNSKHPELSGIVLSLVDEQGRAQDGFLRLHDIYNLNLPAELVVLSACQTALGKEVKGEGLLGLTRGFMYSGARQVMASLWKVDDSATAEFMRDFYRGIFRKELKPAAALRAAQIEMRKKRQWRSPYFWAAFVLQGEYR
jgi:CHAT domain-containing protein